LRKITFAGNALPPDPVRAPAANCVRQRCGRLGRRTRTRVVHRAAARLEVHAHV